MKISKTYYKTIRHFFPKFFNWIDQIPDWRDQKRIKYKAKDMITSGMLIFLLKRKSRRGLNEQRGRDEFDSNCKGLFSLEGIAHGDSINYFLKPLDWKHPHKVRILMVRQTVS